MVASKTTKVIIPKGSRIPDDERRRSIRQLTHKRMKAVLKAKDPDLAFEKDIEANVVDVSLGGIGVCANGHIPAGFDVIVEIAAPKITYSLEGKVVWSAAMPSSGRVLKDKKDLEMTWQMGVQVNVSNEESKKALENLFDAAI